MSKNEQTNPLVQNIKKISLSLIDDFPNHPYHIIAQLYANAYFLSVYRFCAYGRHYRKKAETDEHITEKGAYRQKVFSRRAAFA